MKRKRSKVCHSTGPYFWNKRTSTSWAALPFPALLEIFQRLGDEDRVSAAQVCSHWKKVFDSPSLWRKRTFELGGQKGRTAIQFAISLGKHLRHVSVTCRHVTSNTCVIISNSLVPFLDALKEACLVDFRLDGLEQDRFWKYSYLRSSVVDNLVSFMSTQRKLEIFHMNNSQFNSARGVTVLESLANSSGSNVRNLQIENFFHGRLMVLQCERYRLVMETFTNLTEVALNYCCLSEHLLLYWSTTLKGKLKHISLKAKDNEPFDHVISNGAWSELVAACPGLTLSLSIVGIGCNSDVMPILVTSLPMTYLQFWSGYDHDTELQLSSTLYHVTNSFHHLLEQVDLEFDNFHDNVDDALVAIIARCRKLSTIRIKANTSVEVAATICDMLRDRRTNLSSVDITLCDISDQDIEELQILRERMESMIQAQGIRLSLHDNLF